MVVAVLWIVVMLAIVGVWYYTKRDVEALRCRLEDFRSAVASRKDHSIHYHGEPSNVTPPTLDERLFADYQNKIDVRAYATNDDLNVIITRLHYIARLSAPLAPKDIIANDVYRHAAACLKLLERNERPERVAPPPGYTVK